MYKLYAALAVDPDPEEAILSPAYERIRDNDRTSYFEPISPTLRTHRSLPPSPSAPRRISSASSHVPFLAPVLDNQKAMVTPIYPTFGLHPNFLTSCIGLCTLVFLWIPIPFLHYFGIETFRLPPDLRTWASVLAVALCGVAYNAGFMVSYAPSNSPVTFNSERLSFYRFFWRCGGLCLRQWGIFSPSSLSSSATWFSDMLEIHLRYLVWLGRVCFLIFDWL